MFIRPTTRPCAIAALTALMLLPEIASAADKVWTVYAYGSGNVLRQIFEGMKGFIEDEGYKQMIFVLLLLMMIFTLIKGFIFNRPSPVPIVGLIMAAFILNIALFSRASRADIHIEDQVHGEDYLVEDVPLVLAGASALTSEMSRYMVKLVEAFYMGPSIPQELMMSNNNTYNFTNKIMSALKNVNLSEPHTKATFNSYMRECVVPEMYQGRIRLDGLFNAEPQDFWNSISVGNKARMSVCFQACQAAATPDTICDASECPNPYGTGSASGTSITAREWRGGMMVACDEGHTKLGERITALIGASAFNQLGNTLLRDSSILDGVISSSVTHITGLTGSSGTEHFVRAGMMNMFRESSASVIANGGGQGLIQVIGSNQAKATQRTNWMVAAEVFAESVSYLWSALQAFIYAIFPIAIVLFFFPGVGLKAMGSYFGLLAWISLWMPFLAIINFLSLAWLAEDIRQLAMVPMSYASLVPISEAGSNMQAITNFLGTMVPVLTYGMVKGGEFALTQIATEASAPKASEKGASEIAGKSYSYGSIAANNFGANKFDGTTSTSTGYDSVTNKDGAGAFQSITPQSGATLSMFGNAMTEQTIASSSGVESKSSAFALQYGKSISQENSSAMQAARTADQMLSSSAMDSQTRANLTSRTNEVKDAQQEQTAQAFAYSEALGRTVDAKLGTDTSGRQTTTGAVVNGAIAGMMVAQTLRSGDGGKDAQISAQLDRNLAERFRADGGGSVAEGLRNAGGPALASDKLAEEYLGGVKDQILAMEQAAGKQFSPADATGAMTLLGLSKNSDQTLDTLASDKNGDALLSDKAASFLKNARENMGDTGAGVAGGVAALTEGAFTFMSQNAGPLKALMATDGMLTQTGMSTSNVGAQAGTSSSAQVSDGNTSSRLFAMGNNFAESLGRSRQATQELSTSIKSIVSNTSGVRVAETDTGGWVATATDQITAQDSTSRTVTMTRGVLDAAYSDGLGRGLVERANGADSFIAGIRGKAEFAGAEARAKIGPAADSSEGFEELSARASGAGAAPSNPAVIPLGEGSSRIIEAGQSQSVRLLQSANDPGSPQSQKEVSGAFNQLSSSLNANGRGLVQIAATNDGLRAALDGPQGTGAETVRAAPVMTLGGAKFMKVSDAIATASDTSRAQIAEVESAKTSQVNLDKYYPGLKSDTAFNDQAYFYQMRDEGSASSFLYVPNTDDNLAGVVLPTHRERFGEFLQSANAGAIGVDPNNYRGMSAKDAEEKYDKDLGSRGDAELDRLRKAR